MRAFDIENKRYSDFVLSRLETTELIDAPEQEIPEDIAWNASVEVILKAEPALDQSKKQRLEFDYGMTNGQLRFSVRKAMLFYYLRHYGFDPRETDDGKMRNQSTFLLSIENIDEIEKCIGRRS